MGSEDPARKRNDFVSRAAAHLEQFTKAGLALATFFWQSVPTCRCKGGGILNFLDACGRLEPLVSLGCGLVSDFGVEPH